MECLINGQRIALRDGEEVVLGRDDDTKITLRNCSRRQIGLTLDTTSHTVRLKVLGPNAAACAGDPVRTGEERILKVGDFFSLLHSHADDMLCQLVPRTAPASGGDGDAMVVSTPPATAAPPSPAAAAATPKRTAAEAGLTDHAAGERKEGTAATAVARTDHADEAMEALPADAATAPVGTARATTASVPRLVVTDTETDRMALSPASPATSIPNHPPASPTWVAAPTPAEDPSAAAGSFSEFKCGLMFESAGFTTTRGSPRKLAVLALEGTVLASPFRAKTCTFEDHTALAFSSPAVGPAIKKLHGTGYEVVLVSDLTHKVGPGPNRLRSQMGAVAAMVGCPVRVVCAKPGMKMAAFPRTTLLQPLAVQDADLDASIVVDSRSGAASVDSVGRKITLPSTGRKFAANADMGFKTPEEAFSKAEAPDFTWGCFNPMSIAAGGSLLEPSDARLALADVQELIVCVGSPVGGKTKFIQTHLPSYVAINEGDIDDRGVWLKCLDMCKQALDDGSSVVVDRSNPTTALRAGYIKLAKARGLFVRCFQFTCSLDQARHNNMYRGLLKGRTVPPFYINKYGKQLQEPSAAEGFSEIVKVSFVPDFDCPTLEAFYRQFYA